MRLHPNAKLTPAGRQALVRQVLEQRRPVREVAGRRPGQPSDAVQVAPSLPKRGNRRGFTIAARDRDGSPSERLARRCSAWSSFVGVARRAGRSPRSSAFRSRPSRATSRRSAWAGCGGSRRPRPRRERYEHERPGSLFHIDAKKFARIEGIGHAIHGDRSRKRRGVGWEVVFVCVDDCTRLGLRGGSARGERRACRGLPRARSALVRAPRDPLPSASSRTTPSATRRRPSSPCARSTAPAELHAPLYAPDQRQGRALHPDPQAALGLPLRLPDLGDPSRLAPALARPLQSASDPIEPSASRPPMARLREIRQQAA